MNAATAMAARPPNRRPASHEERGGVSPGAEERGVAERNLPGEAAEEIPALAEDGPEEGHDQHVEDVRVLPGEREDEDGEDRDGSERFVPHGFRPSTSRGVRSA
jgi:hypothetical protein